MFKMRISTWNAGNQTQWPKNSKCSQGFNIKSLNVHFRQCRADQTNNYDDEIETEK